MSLDQSQGQPPPYSLPVPPRHYSHLLFLSPSLKGGVKEEGPGQLGCRPGCNWKLCSFLALQRLRIPHKRKQFRKLLFLMVKLGAGPPLRISAIPTGNLSHPEKFVSRGLFQYLL